MYHVVVSYFFFFNDTATTEIYTLSLHDALPILGMSCKDTQQSVVVGRAHFSVYPLNAASVSRGRSEEHTSELQSRQYLVCRLLLEKKKKKQNITRIPKIDRHKVDSI